LKGGIKYAPASSVRAQESISRATSKTAIAGGGSGGFHRFQQKTRDDDAGDFVVQAQRLLVTIQRPDADQDGDRWLAAKFFQEIVPVLGSKSGWVMAKCAPARLGVEALYFVLKIVGDRFTATPIVKFVAPPSVFPASRSPDFKRCRTLTRPTESTS